MRHLIIPIRILMVFVFSVFIGACGSSDDAAQLTIEQFSSELKNNGMKIGEQPEKAFSLLQATNGLAITVNDERIEVYQYNTTEKTGREALGKYKKDGLMGRKLIVRKNLILVPMQRHANWQQIKEIFEKM